MKKILALALATTLLSGAVQAQELTIAAGLEGGGYDSAAKNLAERLEQRGMTVEVTNHNGSDAITLAVCGGRADMGYTQIDAIYTRALEGCQLRPLGIYGQEVALIMFPPNSRMDELSDLDGDNAVLVDNIGSGTELFWRTIVTTETGDDGNNSDWAQARAVNNPLSMAPTLAEFGDIDAVIMVRRTTAADIQNLLALGWTIGELWDRDIDDLIFNGQPLYEGSRFEVASPSGRPVRGYGYEVRSFIVGSTSVANDGALMNALRVALQ